eukprot:gene3160-biopygen11205
MTRRPDAGSVASPSGRQAGEPADPLPLVVLDRLQLADALHQGSAAVRVHRLCLLRGLVRLLPLPLVVVVRRPRRRLGGRAGERAIDRRVRRVDGGGGGGGGGRGLTALIFRLLLFQVGDRRLAPLLAREQEREDRGAAAEGGEHERDPPRRAAVIVPALTAAIRGPALCSAQLVQYVVF